MKWFVLAFAATVMLAGCASDYGYGGYQVAAGYGAPAYYDDFYGPFWDGYWGPDGGFFYSEGPGRPFHRDFGHHFRREAGTGFHRVMGERHAMATRGVPQTRGLPPLQ